MTPKRKPTQSKPTTSQTSNASKSKPEFIEGWKIGDHLGTGSYGYTYKAENEEGKTVALKLLKESAEPAGEIRFGNEVWALKQINHANFPQFVDEGRFEGRPYVVMSLAKGRTLGAIRQQQLTQKGYCAQIQLLDIIIPILDGLTYLHAKEIFHRDIKDDNIIVNEPTTQVTIIDLGFCKGYNQPNDADTFWNAGASRFSPPTKLENPTEANGTHDVFAVGVLAYLMLTNEFPWSIETNADVGKLKRLMTTSRPRAISDINNTVSSQLMQFVETLLSIVDSDRPTSADALRSAKEVRETLIKSPISASRSNYLQIQLPRIVRDPIHGDIRLTEHEWQVINTREFQRLRHIKQLGLTNLVYPGAEHTRLSHALGTMHVTERILRSIEETHGDKFSLEDRQMARLYALLHDVNHIAFGHTIEDELGFFKRHDKNESRTSRLFFSGGSQIGNALRGTDYGKHVLEYFNPSATVREKYHLMEFIDSPQGSDVIDYIDRDSFFCGLDHKVDSAIYRRYTIVKGGAANDANHHLGLRLYGHSGIRFDAEYALERILTERFSLFLKVYSHSMKFAAGAMLGKALYAASLAKSNIFSEELIEWFGDLEVLFRMRDSKVSLVQEMGKRLIERSLYKPVYKGRVLQPENCQVHKIDSKKHQLQTQQKILTPAERDAFESNLAKACRVNSKDIIVYCPPDPPGLQKIIKSWIETSPGNVAKHESRSNQGIEVLRERHIGLWSIYVFVSPDLDKTTRNAIATEAQIRLGPENEMGQDSRKYVLALDT